MWRKPVDCIRTDDVVRPGLASLLHLPEIVLLVVVEIEALVGIAREPLLKRHTNRAEVGAIILNTSVSAIQTDNSIKYSPFRRFGERHARV